MYVCSMCMYVVICKIDHCINIHWCIVMGLGHNDPWVESHMWPQQTWGQRSCRGQWPLVQVFGKKDQCIHILWCIFKSQYYNDCISMCSRKQARLVVREPPCLIVTVQYLMEKTFIMSTNNLKVIYIIQHTFTSAEFLLTHWNKWPNTVNDIQVSSNQKPFDLKWPQVK